MTKHTQSKYAQRRPVAERESSQNSDAVAVDWAGMTVGGESSRVFYIYSAHSGLAVLKTGQDKK